MSSDYTVKSAASDSYPVSELDRLRAENERLIKDLEGERDEWKARATVHADTVNELAPRMRQAEREVARLNAMRLEDLKDQGKFQDIAHELRDALKALLAECGGSDDVRIQAEAALEKVW